MLRRAACRLLDSTLATRHGSIHPYSRSSGMISRFYSSEIGKQSTSDEVIDLSTEESKRILFNRVLYRSKQRGFLELDLVLGNWVEQNIGSMDETGVRSLVNVLDQENPDLWKWLSGQEEAPETMRSNPVFTALHEKVMNNLNAHSAPETRAIAGKPWVRGWDDFKKGRHGPISEMMDAQWLAKRAFDNLYCVAFKMMDAQWLAKRASYMEFNLEQELESDNVSSLKGLPAVNLLSR